MSKNSVFQSWFDSEPQISGPQTTIPRPPDIFPQLQLPVLLVPPSPNLPTLTPTTIKDEELFHTTKKLTVERQIKSYYDTIEIGSQQFYDLFLDVINKGLDKSNFTNPSRLPSGHALELNEICINISKCIPSTLAEDLFHSMTFKFQINRKIMLVEPIDLFDAVQIIPDTYKLPDIVSESDAKDVLKAFGAKVPDFTAHNGTHRAIKKLQAVNFDSTNTVEGQLTVNNNSNFNGIPIRVALIGFTTTYNER